CRARFCCVRPRGSAPTAVRRASRAASFDPATTAVPRVTIVVRPAMIVVRPAMIVAHETAMIVAGTAMTAARVIDSFPESRVMNDDYAALAESAGSFIHEIKNHLGTLALNLQLLAEDFEEPETQRERRALTRVQRLQSECQRLVDVSNDFLRFARIHDLDMRPCSLNEVVTTMLDFFSPTARQAKIAINSYVPADLPL